MRNRTIARRSMACAAALLLAGTQAKAVDIHNADVVILGSLCVGLDCPNNPSFGFDTIRLQENNLRIDFLDTSNTASFPSNDWKIEINDTTNGGQNRFSVFDVTAGRSPFTIEAAAAVNSLYVDSTSRIGLKTATPVVELHMRDGDTPTVRLEQDGSSGFTAQTWDIAGNEANFFVRDVTNGSRLPFKIKPGAPTDMLQLKPDSIDMKLLKQVRLGWEGILSPSQLGTAQLMLYSNTNDFGGLQLTNNGPTVASRGLLEMFNKGGNYIFMRDTSRSNNWYITQQNAAANRLEFTSQMGSSDLGTGGTTVVSAILNPNGNMTIAGTLTQNSDKANKMAIEPVDSTEILTKIAALPVSTWTYKHDAETGIRHIGPMAQDFYALFGTGEDDKGISTIDTGGVALAAIQALTAQNTALMARIERLEAEAATRRD